MKKAKKGQIGEEVNIALSFVPSKTMRWLEAFFEFIPDKTVKKLIIGNSKFAYNKEISSVLSPFMARQNITYLEIKTGSKLLNDYVDLCKIFRKSPLLYSEILCKLTLWRIGIRAMPS